MDALDRVMAAIDGSNAAYERRERIRREMRARFPHAFTTADLARVHGLSADEAGELVDLWRDLSIRRRGSLFGPHGYWWEWIR